MLLHFTLVLHFAAIVITLCVSITFCGDYFILRHNRCNDDHKILYLITECLTVFSYVTGVQSRRCPTTVIQFQLFVSGQLTVNTHMHAVYAPARCIEMAFFKLFLHCLQN